MSHRRAICDVENRLFTIPPYNAFMVQSWGVSRFNGQLSMLEASVERAGATLARAFSSTGKCEAAVVRARYEALLAPRYFSRMRVLLCATAVSALAALLFILL